MESVESVESMERGMAVANVAFMTVAFFDQPSPLMLTVSSYFMLPKKDFQTDLPKESQVNIEYS